MSFFSELLKSIGQVLTSSARRTKAPAARPTATGAPRAGSAPHATRPGTTAEVSPGQFGPDATAEVDPASIGQVRMSYAPVTDGNPDPGEIVWTWVPFEEHDGRGKDRPVLIVAAETAGTVLAVQLTSKDHDGEGDFVSVGSGPWDREGRESWVNLDRVIRVHPGGMRREASSLGRAPFEKVTDKLRQRYGWR